MRMSQRRLAALGAVSAALWACGGTTTRHGTAASAVATTPARAPGPSRARGETHAATVVGAEGGTLELGNGATLVIPAGALDADVEVTLSGGQPPRTFNHENERMLGPTLQVQPALESLGGAFTLSIPAPPIPEGFTANDLAIAIEEPSAVQRALAMGGVQTRFQLDRATERGGRLVTSLPLLPGYRFQFLLSR